MLAQGKAKLAPPLPGQATPPLVLQLRLGQMPMPALFPVPAPALEQVNLLEPQMLFGVGLGVDGEELTEAAQPPCLRSFTAAKSFNGTRVISNLI